MAQIFKIDKKNNKKGAFAPLFDRLVDEDPSSFEDKTLGQLSLEELKASILKEISLVLNTRPSSKRLAEPHSPDSISDYALPSFFGLADFSWFEGGSDFYQHKIARKVEEVVRYYEPRLHNPRVKVSKLDQTILGASVEISGDIIYNDMRERVNFPITLSNIFSK